MTPIQIQKIRKAQRETQREFAARLGVHVGTLRKWEQGRGSPSSMAVRLLEASRAV
jgi:DNA-binding transcriptional regulator YiaG